MSRLEVYCLKTSRLPNQQNTDFYIVLLSHEYVFWINNNKFQHRRSQEGQRSHGPKIASLSCRFVLREAVSQTKYCCSLKVTYLAPPKILRWLRHWIVERNLKPKWQVYTEVGKFAPCIVIDARQNKYVMLNTQNSQAVQSMRSSIGG